MKKQFYSNKPYLIAETAYTFEGDYNYLFEQTKDIPNVIDAIKYHMLINLDEYMVEEHPVYDLLKNWILSEDNWKDILTEAKSNKLDTIILADDKASVEFCAKNHELVDAIEIHSACINDIELLDDAIDFSNEFNKTFILGISGFEIQELLDVTEYIKSKNVKDILMMYGFQNFPTDIEKVNLSKIKVLENLLNCKIGYADHTEYSKNKELLINASYSLGANVQEVHYVKDEGLEKTDYITGVGIERLCSIKENLEIIFKALGSNDLRLNDGEKKYLNFRKVPLYMSDLESKQIFRKIINCT